MERKIGQLNGSVRSTPFACRDLPAYLWPEMYMAMCHIQNLVLRVPLQRELKKEHKQQEEETADQKEKDDEINIWSGG